MKSKIQTNGKKTGRIMGENKIRKNKRAQHEMVGFVLIVVIVVIIGLFLLVYYLKQEPVEVKSADVQNFLQSSMLYTTDCVLRIEPLDLKSLIKSCYKNEGCLNGEMACNMLDSLFPEIIQNAWDVGSGKPANYYSLDIYYEERDELDSEGSKGEKGESRDEILSLKEGNCTGSRTGAETMIPYSPGNIIVDMKICKIG